MLQIAICDDNFPLTTEVENMLLSVGKQKCIPMNIDVFFDGRTLYQKIQAGYNYDIIYLDIEMNDVDGIQAAHLIRALNSPTILIYISAYETYFKQLFEVEPFRFLSKPIDISLFNKYFSEAYKKLNSQTNFFTFCFNQRYTNIPIADIIYFESCGRDIIVHTSQNNHRFLNKLDYIEKNLNDREIEFLRIHQSYLVNPYYISSLSLSEVMLHNGLTLRIGPKYQSHIRSRYIQMIEDL